LESPEVCARPESGDEGHVTHKSIEIRNNRSVIFNANLQQAFTSRLHLTTTKTRFIASHWRFNPSVLAALMLLGERSWNNEKVQQFPDLKAPLSDGIVSLRYKQGRSL
jgi:hypothetical protein